ncbi:BON domain-containing protein [Paraburkholderia lycopersici]|uniref:BON domain-containing protein n=1 Tax=Paraburkholderia lycopersici TaxID=416944 RepID=A0A1G6PJ00_9BURK|nr:BON domain-containing protein [Paraburkholderia lycopersici]SDC80133.1 BON domain-containing protein [Paraburkholderia lycopersici]
MSVKMKRLDLWMAAALLAAIIGVPGAYAQSQGDSGVAASAPAAVSAPAQSRKEKRRADRALAKTVRRALVRVKGLDSGRIVVIAQGGAVTLGGSVPDAGQIDVAVAAAKGVNGVRDVTSSLSVKAPGQ